MERLRHSLHEKIDALLRNIIEDDSASECTQLQIEACIRQNGDAVEDLQSSRRIVVDTINIQELRQSTRPTRRTVSVPADGLLSPVTDNSPVPSTREEQTDDHSPRTTRRGNQISQKRLSTRRNVVGGLRLGNGNSSTDTSPPTTPTIRQLETHSGYVPKRRKLDKDRPVTLEQSTVDKLIGGIWEQIHEPQTLALGKDLGDVFDTVIKRLNTGHSASDNSDDFADASKCCQQISSGSRTSRALEVIIQAHWVDCYEDRITLIQQTRSELTVNEVKKLVFTEACKLFQWSEKELRNRSAVWRGYHAIKNAAGWAALVFAGPGIYRFCKYRSLGCNTDAIAKLKAFRTRIEVAADTLKPQWRQLLLLVGESTQRHWHGHPHDWVVSKRKDPVPLSITYRQWDPNFTFTNISESIIDKEQFPDYDPRRSSPGPNYICETCFQPQSLLAERNECSCFPDLFSPNPQTPALVQVFSTDNGRNNGLIALVNFAPGAAIGEFVGLITKGLSGVDVMQSQVQVQAQPDSNSSSSSSYQNQNQNPTINPNPEPYQIHQGKQGNFTRFINHSCSPNSKFVTFTWLGIQRIIIVSKGVPAGREITVDYSDRYWRHLDKICLCGEARCRYTKSVGERGSGNGGR